MRQFTSELNFGDKVVADGGDIVMTVTGFCFYPHGGQVQCSWFSNGVHYQAWFEDWRLKEKS